MKKKPEYFDEGTCKLIHQNNKNKEYFHIIINDICYIVYYNMEIITFTKK